MIELLAAMLLPKFGESALGHVGDDVVVVPLDCFQLNANFSVRMIDIALPASLRSRRIGD